MTGGCHGHRIGKPIAPLQQVHKVGGQLRITRPDCNACPPPVPATPAAALVQVQALQTLPPVVLLPVANHQLIGNCFACVDA